MLEGYEGFEVLEDNEHFRFGADPDRCLLLVSRKPAGMITASRSIGMLRGVGLILGEPEGWSVLFDTREAIGRSGPEFEADARRLRDYMLEHYKRVAIVVKSAIGHIQVQRLEDPKARMLVFRNVDNALGFLALHD